MREGSDEIYNMLLERAHTGEFGGAPLSTRHQRLVYGGTSEVVPSKQVQGEQPPRNVGREQKIYGMLVRRAGQGRFGRDGLSADERDIVFGS